MAAFTTAAIVGAAVVGAAATVYSVNQQKKAAKKQQARLDRQETEAKEAAKLNETRDETGAELQLGLQDAGSVGSGAGSNATSRTGSVKRRVGVTTMPDASPSRRVGL